MKKALFLFLFVVRVVSAQKYQPFDSNMVWRMEVTGFNNCYHIQYYYTNGYIINNGIMWHKVYTNISPGVPCTTDNTISNAFLGHFTNDTLAKKVYFIGSTTLAPNFVPGPSDLLFDFNKTLGDTLNLSSGLKYKIVTLDSTLLGLKYHKVFKGANINTTFNYSPYYVYLVEGVGSSLGVFNKNFNVFSNTSSFQLTCFYSEGFAKQFIRPNHSPQTYPTSLSDTSSCGFTITGVISYSGQQESLKMYPNPARDFLQIQVQGAPHKLGFQIINCIGQTIREEEISVIDKIYKINVGDLVEGIYFVTVFYDQKPVETRKLLIVR